jgi:hypothetical protein
MMAGIHRADPLEGALRVGFFGGGLPYFQDGRVLRSYTSADGLADGSINDFRIEADGILWIATEGGLSRLKKGRGRRAGQFEPHSVRLSRGRPCRRDRGAAFTARPPPAFGTPARRCGPSRARPHAAPRS